MECEREPMSRYCLVDQNIQLSSHEVDVLKSYFQVYETDLAHPDPDLAKMCETLLIHSKMTTEMLHAFPNCKYIGVRAKHADYVDLKSAHRRGIHVSWIPQLSSHAVAEHTFSLLLALAKQLIPLNRQVADDLWRKGVSPLSDLHGKTIGIIGYGQIGQEVERIARAFGMHVLIAAKPGQTHENRFSLDEVVEKADVLTIHASTSANAMPILNEDHFEKMKPNLLLINTARGSLVDEAALIRALRNGKIAGAGLDVFLNEPMVNHDLTSLPNVICTPHLAYYTTQTIQAMNQALIDQAIAFFTSMDEKIL
jgi:glycerate dehydrogenase